MGERKGSFQSSFKDFDSRAKFFKENGRMPEDPVGPMVRLKVKQDGQKFHVSVPLALAGQWLAARV